MDTRERLETAKARLTPGVARAFQRAVDSGAVPRTIHDALPGRLVDDAVRGAAPLESLVASEGPRLAASVSVLEAIVQRYGRPPLLVRNDTVAMEPLDDLPGADALIKGVEFCLTAVGRVEFINSGLAWGGTGWIVESKGDGAIVVTNRHVACIVARRKADGNAVFMRSPSGARYGAQIDFKEELGSVAGDRSATVQVAEVTYLADDIDADVALLKLAATALHGRPTIRLDLAAVQPRELVALIGYPAYDSRNDASDQARYFRDLYEVKRLSPGRILQAGEGRELLNHDCTSMGGSSGSPVIRLGSGGGDAGGAIGLHFSGVYGKENAAVPARVVQALLDGVRPVHVTVQGQAEDEAADGHHPADRFLGRTGFDTRHLGEGAFETPWPGLPARFAKDLAEPNPPAPREPHELAYTHFGVKYSTALRLPLLTAVNIDGARSVRIKRGRDVWFTDGRIPREVQLGAANFKDPEIDRGHMVRREDPNWSFDGGDVEAQQADNDTFHYVNAAAQHSRLNQGKALWQGLENYILNSARTHGFRACVFTGPVLVSAEEEREETVINGAVVPLEFWKLVVTLGETGKTLHATAYLLSQGDLIRSLMDRRWGREAFEGFVLGEYRTFQLTISDLAAATEYDFSDYVAADALKANRTANEAMEKREPVVLPIATLADLRL